MPGFSGGKLHLENAPGAVWIRNLCCRKPTQRQEILPPLSVSQFRLLEILYEKPRASCPAPRTGDDRLGEGQAFDISEQALDALVRRLRDRIASVDPAHEYIVTVRGHGLRLENPTD